MIKALKRLIRFILIILIAAAGIIIYMGHNKYKSATKELTLDKAVSEIRMDENFTELSDIPEIYKNALIAVEDRRFYYHNGIDVIGLFRAVITDIKERALVEGGSTITQQLAKNIYFEMDNSPWRKVAEIFVAFDIEEEYSKDEILELYINGIYYGDGYYNIYDAANGYFGKIPSELSDYEATLLAGIPNAPSVYSLTKNPELAEKRQDKVLKNMVVCGYLSEEESDEIKKKRGERTD